MVAFGKLEPTQPDEPHDRGLQSRDRKMGLTDMSDIQATSLSGAERYRQIARPSAPLNSPSTQAAASQAAASQAGGANRIADRSADRVEISQLARELAQQEAKNEAPIRQDLVDRVRAEIAAGTYDTPERLNGAIDGLVDDLRLEA